MIPHHDATREHLTLKLHHLQRAGKLDQVEICDALRSEYERGWRHREEHLQLSLSRLSWGMRQIVTWLAKSPGSPPD